MRSKSCSNKVSKSKTASVRNTLVKKSCNTPNKKLSEAEVTKIFKREIKKVSDCFYERFEPTCFYGKGRSDFLVVRNGRIFFLELKSTIGKQSPAQRRYQNKVEGVGAKYLIVRDQQSCTKAIKEIMEA